MCVLNDVFLDSIMYRWYYQIIAKFLRYDNDAVVMYKNVLFLGNACCNIWGWNFTMSTVYTIFLQMAQQRELKQITTN